MSATLADRNLLFGIVALQMELISRDALIEGMHAWALDKSKRLGDLLVERGVLASHRCEMLDALIDAQLSQNGHDLAKSLQCLSSVSAGLKDRLEQIGDRDLSLSLAVIPQPTAGAFARQDPHKTVSWAGEATSEGTRFQIIRPLASGGLGKLSIAVDSELKREVALKEIKESHADSPQNRSRFLTEAEITGQLEHPGIVPIYGLGTYADGRPFYAMRLIKGDSLKEAVEQFHAQPATRQRYESREFRQLLGRFVDVCQAVAYAHDRGVLHRDLKPGNIMLGKYGETLVVDWGLAKATGRDDLVNEDGERAIDPSSLSSSADTVQGSLVGTLAYASPEQAAGRLAELDQRSDVYSLGATLYTLLTGTLPIDAADAGEMLRKLQRGEIAAPRQRQPEIPRPVEAICQRAMAADPPQRYASALDLARDLENWMAGERVLAWREPWHVGARRYLRRHRALAGMLAALAVVLPLAIVLGSWLVAQERAEREIALRTAEVKAKSAAEIADYLKRTFQSADPLSLDAEGFHGPGERTQQETIHRMLDGGFGLLRDNLHDQPLVRASLLETIGNSYRSLGLWAEARTAIEEAHDLRLRETGAGSADTLASQHSLARLAHDEGNYVEAERLYREVIHGREQLAPPQPLLVAQTKYHFAWVLFYRPLGLEQPQFDPRILKEAEQALLEALQARQAELPANHRDIGLTWAALAVVKACQGQQMAATGYAGLALELFRSSDQENLLGSVMMDYARAERLRYSGHQDEAEAIYQKILALARKHLGSRHHLVVLHMGNMVGMYRAQGNVEKGEPLLREMLDIIRTSPPMRSMPVIVDAMMQYGDFLRQRSSEQALAMYEEALQFSRERPRENEKTIQALEQRKKDLESAR